MANEFSYFENLINSKILNMHTAYLGRVKQVKGSTAIIQPLTMYKAMGGDAKTQSLASAFIPPNVKFHSESITYLKTVDEQVTTDVLIPDSVAVGDTVFVGICDRDITNAKNGNIAVATQRHHNINDGVVLLAW